MKNKIYNNFVDALADVSDGASVMLTCLLGPAGIPQNLILGLKERGVKNLTVYSCANFGFAGGTRMIPGLKPYITPAVLVENHQVKKAIVAWTKSDGATPNILDQEVHAGTVEVEILPLGIFAQKVAAAAHGFGGFYSPVGVGTLYEKGKEKRIINGREYLYEAPIRARFGLVRAYKADKRGNLIYKGIARGINPLIARACDITIAEVDEIVEPGEIDSDEVVTPGVYIDRIVKISEEGWK